MALQFDDIPDLPADGADKVEAGEAFWVPVHCSQHDGFTVGCEACLAAWKSTRDAMIRVAAAQ